MTRTFREAVWNTASLEVWEENGKEEEQGCVSSGRPQPRFMVKWGDGEEKEKHVRTGEQRERGKRNKKVGG